MPSTGPRRPGAGCGAARARRATPQPRARATRLAILTAAADHFARSGYHGTSLDDVLADSGSTKGALYFHFASKEALARAVVAEMMQGWGNLRVEVSGRGLDPLSTLLALVDDVVERLIGNPIFRGGARLLNDLPMLAREERGHYGVGEHDAVTLLTEAMQEGLLREAIDPALVARHIVALITGHRQVCEATGDRDNLRQRVEEAWTLLLPAIATDEWVVTWRASHC